MEKTKPVYDDTAIAVQHLVKHFRIYKDKSHTFKERILFRKRNRYEINKVLDDISFEVQKGTAIGLIGHNGCGKSTTLKLLNRILIPDGGTIRMKGRVSSLIELGAGFHPDMSGRENIYINATIFGLRKKEIDERIDTIIRFSELEEFIDNPVRTYSSGMYMRLAFSVAINVDADILLVDEILAVGDANFQKKCFDKLQEIKNKGTTIVIVSHSMDQMKSLCDRVIWLENGKIMEEGSASVVCNDYLLAMSDNAKKRLRQEQKLEGLAVSGDPNELYPLDKVAEKQCSKYARREGNMEARIVKAELVNAKGELTTHFAYGDEAHIRFSVQKFVAKPQKYNIVVVITQNNGPRCTQFESYLAKERYQNIEELENGELVIENLPLAEGEFFLDICLWDENIQMLDNVMHIIDFNVISPKKKGFGVVSMNIEWRNQK